MAWESIGHGRHLAAGENCLTKNTFLIDAVSTSKLHLKKCSNASQPFLNFGRWKTQIRAV